MLEEALAVIARDGYAVSTRARMLAARRGLCGWLQTNGHLKVDPATGDGLRIRSEPSRIPVALTDDELARLVVTVTTVDPGAQVAPAGSFTSRSPIVASHQFAKASFEHSATTRFAIANAR